jgi:opacity protein-like surface antigen
MNDFESLLFGVPIALMTPAGRSPRRGGESMLAGVPIEAVPCRVDLVRSHRRGASWRGGDRMRRHVGIGILMIVVASLAAQGSATAAEEVAAGDADASRSGPYVLIGSGFGVVEKQDTELGSNDVELDYDDAGLADLSLGYRVLPFLRVEANVSYRQHHIENINAEGLAGFSHKGDIHVIGGLANFIADYPIGEQIERDSIPMLVPYAGFGFGVLWTKPRAELRTTPERKIRGEGTEFAWNLLAGVDIPITRRVGLQVGYRYLESLDQSWKLKIGASSAGDVEAPYRTHEGRVGIRIGY